MPELTIGEQIVRTEFNPSKNGTVDTLKKKFAELINLVDELKTLDPKSVEISKTELQTACMYAVYAATTPQS